MSELYLCVTVLNRNLRRKYINLFKATSSSVVFGISGHGTADNDILNALGLEDSEKSVFLSVITGDGWKDVKKMLTSRIQIDIPGTGIAFLIPLSSIGGRRQLLFLTGMEDFEKGEESVLKDTKYELLVSIVNQGNTSLVMDAARGAGAYGGTVLHAKGTGMEGAKQFLNVSLVDEKEMVMIVVKKSQKNDIMSAIMDKAGLSSEAGAIAFSLPVTAIAGMRLMEEEEEEEQDILP